MFSDNSNQIENEFFKMFEPILLWQSVLGYVRIQYRNNNIYKKSLPQKLYSFVMLCLSSYALYIAMFVISPVTLMPHRPIFYYMGLLNYCLIVMKNVILTIDASVTTCGSNVKLYKIIQNIDRSLNLNRNEGQYRRIYKRNLTIIIIAICYYLLNILWYYSWIIPEFKYVWTAIAFTSIASEELEFINLANLIHHIDMRLNYVNRLIKERANVKFKDLIRNTEKGNTNDSDIIKGFEYVTIAYQLIQKLYGVFVSLEINII